MSASQRRLWNTDSSTPAESAAAASSRPTSAVGANGLSATTCTPAATASRTSSRRVSGGVVIVTASTPLASSAPRLSKTGTPGQSSATSARRCGRARDDAGELDALGGLDERRVEEAAAGAVPDDARASQPSQLVHLVLVVRLASAERVRHARSPTRRRPRSTSSSACGRPRRQDGAARGRRSARVRTPHAGPRRRRRPGRPRRCTPATGRARRSRRARCRRHPDRASRPACC